MKHPLEVRPDERAHGPDGLCHAIKAVPPRTVGEDGYHWIWHMPTAETLCGVRNIYPSEKWQLTVTWHREQPVTCPRCHAELSQRELFHP